MKFDLFDAVTLVGLALIGGALWFVTPLATMFYAGAVLAVIGILGSR